MRPLEFGTIDDDGYPADSPILFEDDEVHDRRGLYVSGHGWLSQIQARTLTKELVAKYFPPAKEKPMGAFQFRIGRLAIFREGITSVFAGKGKRWRRLFGRVFWLSYAPKGCKA